MGIFIKNAEVERKARALAQRQGKTLTAVIDEALDAKLREEQPAKKPRPTVEEMMAATERFRKAVGLDKRKLNVTKADFDALWEIPGLSDDRE